MNKKEIAQLLTVASGFDRRVVDPVTVEAWALVPEIMAADYTAAVGAVVAHQTGPKRSEYLTVGHIVEALTVAGRDTRAAVEGDVRVAKARGLVGADWPARQKLDPDVADALQTLRDLDRRTAAKYLELEPADDDG